MSVPVEPDGPGWRTLTIAVSVLLTGLFSWIANSLRNEQKEQGERISKLENKLPSYISRDELTEELTTLRADNLRMHQETRADNLRMHGDNQGLLQRIEDKVERGSQTRHDIRDGVNAVQLMLRATLEKMRKGEG